MKAVEFLRNAEGIFYDGELVIVPEEDSELIAEIKSNFEVISEEKGFGDRYATLAIKSNVEPKMVSLGNAVEEITGMSAEEMVSSALNEPMRTEQAWRELYQSSMNSH